MTVADPARVLPDLPPAIRALRVLRLEYDLAAIDRTRLPAYLGSTLRGAFGWALKETVCTTGHSSCASCLRRRVCPYPYLFETEPTGPRGRGWMQSIRRVPVPYSVQPFDPGSGRVRRGNRVRFRIVLYGRATEMAPLVTGAVRAFARRGLGPIGAGAVFRMAGCRRVLPDESTAVVPRSTSRASDAVRPEERLADHAGRSLAGPIGVDLDLETPLRLKSNGAVLDRFEFRRFALSICRRAAALAAFHENLPVAPLDESWRDQAEAVEVDDADVRWRSMKRYSNRQRREVPVGGLRGRVRLRGVSPALVELLRVGQVLQVGHGTAYGLGRYRVTGAGSARHEDGDRTNRLTRVRTTIEGIR